MGLTARESQVLELTQSGMRPKYIAAELGISAQHVDNLRRSLRGKGMDVPRLKKTRTGTGRPVSDPERDDDEQYGPFKRCQRCDLAFVFPWDEREHICTDAATYATVGGEGHVYDEPWGERIDTWANAARGKRHQAKGKAA